MGFTNLFAVKRAMPDAAPAATALPEQVFATGNPCFYNSLALTPLSEALPQPDDDPADRERKALARQGHHGLFACNPWHTSGHGTLILTTDYLINLFCVDAFAAAETPDEVQSSLVRYYRKEMRQLRQCLRDEDATQVSQRPLLKAHPRAAASLGEPALPDQDITDFGYINYDLLSYDRQATPDDFASLRQRIDTIAQSQGRPFVSHDHLALDNFRSAYPFCSLDQSDIAIVRYHHMTFKRAVFLKRSRRTPASILLNRQLATPAHIGPRFRESHALLVEFFASIGFQANL